MSSQTLSNPSQTTSESPPERRSEPDQLPLDVIFQILSNERRRRVLRYLRAESETATLGDLAEHIAAIENDKPETTLTSSERKRVYIALYQCHLPKMDDAGVIHFDENRKFIEVDESIEQVAEFLPEKASHEPSGITEGWATVFADFVRAVGRRVQSPRTS